MAVNKTEAWVLRKAARRNEGPGVLERCVIDLPEMTDNDILAEPIYGCWEGNMTHALERDPVDVCLYRLEHQVVLGNAGVLRILARGSNVRGCEVGDLCISQPSVEQDRHGHTLKVLAYDARGTIGVLARRVVWHQSWVIPLVLREEMVSRLAPPGVHLVPGQPTQHSYKRWAGFPIRYTTAWDNWKLAFRLRQAQMEEHDMPPIHVWAWGGGVSFAELQLARHQGCRVAMIASTDKRLAQLSAHGIAPIDRRQFPDLASDEERARTDPRYRSSHHESQKAFLSLVRQMTDGEGVSIFIDNIGAPLFQTTLRSLGRMGIVATTGWKKGQALSYDRANCCIGRHLFVHSHGCHNRDGITAALFAEANNWLPPEGAEEYSWDDLPKLAADFAAGKIESYFPIFHVNPL